MARRLSYVVDDFMHEGIFMVGVAVRILTGLAVYWLTAPLWMPTRAAWRRLARVRVQA